MSIVRNASVAALLVAGVAAPAQAVVFAQYFTALPNQNTTNFRYANSGNNVNRATDATFSTSPSGTTLAAVPVTFSFTVITGLTPFVRNVAARLAITGAVPTNTPATGAINQPGLGGSMTFLSTAPITVTGPAFNTTTYAAGSNLLTVTFDDANLLGVTGARIGRLEAFTAQGATVTFTSDFLDFSVNGSSSLVTNLSAMTLGLGAGTGNNKALRTFRARLQTGSFDTSVVPRASATVPEPQSWTLLIVGFGLVGTAMRRRAVRSA
jgi:PEP-CTERM motif